MDDVVVLLPGIMGSVLRRDGRDVWALSGGAALGGLLSRGGSIRGLALDGDPGDEDPRDGVTADRLMPDVHLLPGFWKIDGYDRVAGRLKATFGLTEGEDFVAFPYDWRLSCAVAAARLQRESHDWLARQRARGKPGARLILVAHSMGGLVARHFLEVLGGWQVTRALITFGTPYRGALNALDALVNGVRKGPFGLADFSAFVRSLPSAYQLLPTYECYDPGGGRLVRVAEAAGIPNVDPARAQAALAFHRAIRDQVERNRRDAAYHDAASGYRIFPIVGNHQPTIQSARAAVGGVEFLESHEGKDARGDGTVPRPSATPIEIEKEGREMFAATRHASLQNADAVLAHVGGLIGDLSLNLGRYRAVPPPGVKLAIAVEDAYWAEEPVVARVRPDREPAGGGPLPLRAVVVDAGTGREVARAAVGPRPDAGGWRRAELPPLPPGAYRLTVRGEGGAAEVEPASDVFVVLDAEVAAG